MNNFKRAGETMPFTGQAKAAGVGVLIGTLVGIVANTVLSTEIGTALLEGVFDVAKVSAQGWTVGAKVYWDDTAHLFTTTSSGNTFAGIADAAAANPTSTGLLNLGAGYP